MRGGKIPNLNWLINERSYMYLDRLLLICVATLTSFFNLPYVRNLGLVAQWCYQSTLNLPYSLRSARFKGIELPLIQKCAKSRSSNNVLNLLLQLFLHFCWSQLKILLFNLEQSILINPLYSCIVSKAHLFLQSNQPIINGTYRITKFLFSFVLALNVCQGHAEYCLIVKFC